MLKFVVRVGLVAAAMIYALPYVTGVKFHGDAAAALATSLVFNVAFSGLEWLLGVVVLGINIGTLGLGVIITTTLRYVADVLAPSAALFGTAHLMPRFLEISSYSPAAIVAGLALGGLMYTMVPGKKRR